jgi:CheY-like chemotaxis protein
MNTQDQNTPPLRMDSSKLTRKNLPLTPVGGLAAWQHQALQSLFAAEPILVTDDDHMSRTFYRALLQQQFGFQMLDTYDAAQALEICRAQPISLLISCLLKPPGMDGFELAEHLKSNPATQQIPLLFISGSPHAEELILRAGADAFLAKPCHPYDILNKIWLLLRERVL